MMISVLAALDHLKKLSFGEKPLNRSELLFWIIPNIDERHTA
jgi:hypothetical protein